MDSTSNVMVALSEVINEWMTLKRRGKIILHSDGDTIKKVEFDYYLDF